MYHLHDEKSEKNRNRSDENSGEMIDDLLDDGIDFDGLPPVMKGSTHTPQSKPLVICVPGSIDYKPRSPTLLSYASVSNSPGASYRSSRDVSRSVSPFSRHRRDSIMSFRSRTEQNLQEDSYDSFLPILNGLLSWDVSHVTSLSVVRSDSTEENLHSITGSTVNRNLSKSTSPSGSPHRQSIMNSNFSAIIGNVSSAATRQPLEPSKHPSPHPPSSTSYLNIPPYSVKHSSSTSMSSQTTSGAQSPFSRSRSSSSSIGGYWLVKPPDEASSDIDTERGSNSAQASPPRLQLPPTGSDMLVSRRGRIRKGICIYHSTESNESSIMPSKTATPCMPNDSNDNILHELMEANNLNIALKEVNEALQQENLNLRQRLESVNQMFDTGLLRGIVKGAFPPSDSIKDAQPNCMTLTYL